jgi:Tfp pilus assembly protein PilF
MAEFLNKLFSKGALPKGDIVPMKVGMKAESLQKRGDLRSALEVYEKFLQSHPRSALALNNAAILHLELNNPKSACQLLERAIRVDPEYAAAWCNMGAAKRMLKDILGSRDAYENTLKLDPKNVRTLIGYARLFMDAKNPKRACQLLEKAVHLDCKNSVAWHNLGGARFKLGDIAGAKNAFETALKLDPRDEITRKSLQDVLTTEKMMAHAHRTGATLRGQGGTIFSDKHGTLVCAKCGVKYTEFGQVSITNKALGGASCNNCGKFYCEPCVSKVLHSGVSPMICICGKSRAQFGDDGYVSMSNFKELVVFCA